MSKTKNKSHKKEESNLGYIRELEKEIRSLRQLVRKYEKYERSQESDRINDSEDTIEISRKLIKPCLNCGKGNLVETLELMGKIYGECDCCSFKGRMDNQ